MTYLGLRTTAYNEALAYTRGVKPEDLSTDYSKVIPIGRDGKLDEVGSLVAYLVSDQASYITALTYKKYMAGEEIAQPPSNFQKAGNVVTNLFNRRAGA